MNWLQSIPKPVLVSVILAAGIIFIMIGDPPKNACDAQLDVFLTSQSGRLTSLRGRIGSLWSRTAKYCQQTKTLGGCAEFHNTIRLALRDLQNSSVECLPHLIAQESVQKILQDSLVLMVKMAWGEKPPEPGPYVYGWMGMSELALFCGLQKNIQRYLSDEEWEQWVRKTIAQLPQAKELSFDEGFGRSLFSVRCESVL